MEQSEFAKLKERYLKATTDEKIQIYVGTEALTQNQYRDLLLLFPRAEIDKLEAALA